MPSRPSLFINAISNWGPLGVNLIIGFFLIPYLITRLGKENYGIWALAGSFIGYYGLLRLGVGSGVMRYVPLYIGRGDQKSCSETVSTALAIFLVVGLLIFVISFWAADSISRFFNSGPEFASLIRILGVAAAIECPMRILDGVVRAHEKWVAANFITIIVSIARALGLSGSVYCGYGLIQMGYVMLLVTLLSFVLIILLFLYVCPVVRVRFKLIKLSPFKALLAFGILSTLATLAWSLTLQGHSLIIGKLISLEAVSVYAVAAIVVKNARAMVVAPNRAFWPRFALLDGENNQKEIISLFHRATYYNAIFSSGIMLLILVAGSAFIRLWVGEGFEAIYSVLIILTLGYLVETSLAVVPPLLGGMGRQKSVTILAIAEGGLGISLSVFLTWKWGLPGAALGFTIAVFFIRGLTSTWYVCRLFRDSLWCYYCDSIFKPWAIVLVFVLATHFFKISQYMTGWSSLVLMVLVIGLLYSLSVYGIILKKDDRAKVAFYLRKIINRKSVSRENQ